MVMVSLSLRACYSNSVEGTSSIKRRNAEAVKPILALLIEPVLA